ncbi:hypothetical protein T12_14072 [Trichinella patagoniensis]|uniref:Uncharacterized protein n=1 Tax=Trichinella patagoniensis TaxID=990121 RepID=A0A0V0ZD82_9BILA|nr:hypothetical protein T12_14072 [Trichinella patagoniensis]
MVFSQAVQKGIRENQYQNQIKQNAEKVLQNANDITSTQELSGEEYKCGVDELLLWASNEPVARPPII